MGGASVSLANTCQYIPNLGQPFIHKSEESGAPRAVREKPRRREVVCATQRGVGAVSTVADSCYGHWSLFVRVCR